MRKNGKTEVQLIIDEYKLKDQQLSDLKSVTFKPYKMKSKWTVSNELKRCLPFLFGGVIE